MKELYDIEMNLAILDNRIAKLEHHGRQVSYEEFQYLNKVVHCMMFLFLLAILFAILAALIPHGVSQIHLHLFK